MGNGVDGAVTVPVTGLVEEEDSGGEGSATIPHRNMEVLLAKATHIKHAVVIPTLVSVR